MGKAAAKSHAPKRRQQPRAKRQPAGPRWYVKEWLHALGKKQEWLVAEGILSRSVASEIVNGKKRFNEDHLRKIATALGLSPGTILDIDPTGDPALVDLISQWRSLNPDDRAEILAMARTKVERRRRHQQ